MSIPPQHPPAGLPFPLTRRPGIIPAGEGLPPTTVPLGRIVVSCLPTHGDFERLQNELRERVRALGGTFAGHATVRYRAGRIHLEATAMLWPCAIPAGDPPAACRAIEAATRASSTPPPR